MNLRDRTRRNEEGYKESAVISSHLDALPCWVGVHAVVNVELQTHGEPLHELCARGDTVTVKMGARWLHWGKLTPTRLQICTDSLDFINLLTAFRRIDKQLFK